MFKSILRFDGGERWRRRKERRMRRRRIICWFAGHSWGSIGGRECPKGYRKCSQTVYRCLRCGQDDYGWPYGPAYEECGECTEQDIEMAEDILCRKEET